VDQGLDCAVPPGVLVVVDPDMPSMQAQHAAAVDRDNRKCMY
jgi:hypothetical protein